MTGYGPPARPGSRPEPDVLSFGRQAPPRVRLPWWAGAGIVLVAIVALTTVALTAGRGHHGRPSPVTVTQIGHPLLGVTGDWQLAGLGPGRLVEIQFARGRIISTRLPTLRSAGPTSLVAGSGEVIIRPLDNVPGYAVPDGQPARALPPLLGHGGLAMPGPQPGLMWVSHGIATAHLLLSLVSQDGKGTGISVPIPPDGPWLPVPDGHGYFLYSGFGGVYDADSGGPQFVTTATVVATGPTDWLAVRCVRPFRQCANVVIQPANGAQWELPGPAVYPGFPDDGLTSPDGATAAVFSPARAGHLTLRLVNLGTGLSRPVAIPASQLTFSVQTIAWSPDSRWLFVATQSGRLLVVSASTGRVGSLGVRLPPVQVLTVTGPARR
jgi:hypothetical protein